MRIPRERPPLPIPFLAFLLALTFVASGCSRSSGCGFPGRPSSREEVVIVLASTTSTDDTGLFEVLLPAFEKAHPGHRVAVVAVGTGQALAMGRAGDADALLVHSREAEERFVEEGYGHERRDLMYNDFMIVGPPSDPAGIAGFDEVLGALRAIAEGDVRFISRSDDSGTHKREFELLEEAGLDPSGEWRLAIGQGMGEALVMASEMEAYTLSDRGTYLAMRGRLELEVLLEGDERLLNPYGVIAVKTARNPDAARVLADWLLSNEAREIIRGFGIEEHGMPLFFPHGE